MDLTTALLERKSVHDFIELLVIFLEHKLVAGAGFEPTTFGL